MSLNTEEQKADTSLRRWAAFQHAKNMRSSNELKVHSLMAGEAVVTKYHFNCFICGFGVISLVDLQRHLRKFANIFRHFEVTPDNKNQHLSLEVSFYRTNQKDVAPLEYNCEDTEISFSSLSNQNAFNGLSNKKKNQAKEIIAQFSFVEKFVSGNISASISVNANEDTYTIIFSNVPSVHSGFINNFRNSFQDISMHITIVANPFEVHVAVLKQDDNAAKQEPAQIDEREEEDSDILNEEAIKGDRKKRRKIIHEIDA